MGEPHNDDFILQGRDADPKTYHWVQMPQAERIMVSRMSLTQKDPVAYGQLYMTCSRVKSTVDLLIYLANDLLKTPYQRKLVTFRNYNLNCYSFFM